MLSSMQKTLSKLVWTEKPLHHELVRQLKRRHSPVKKLSKFACEFKIHLRPGETAPTAENRVEMIRQQTGKGENLNRMAFVNGSICSTSVNNVMATEIATGELKKSLKGYNRLNLEPDAQFDYHSLKWEWGAPWMGEAAQKQR